MTGLPDRVKSVRRVAVDALPGHGNGYAKPWRLAPDARRLVVAVAEGLAGETLWVLLTRPITRLLTLATALTTLAATPRPTPAAQNPTATLEGRILSAADNEPVPHALVSLPTLQRRTFAEADGTFRLPNLPAGTHTLRVEQLGYHTTELDVALPTSTPLTVRLEPRPLPLEELAAVASPAECVSPGFPDPATAPLLTQILDEVRKLAERALAWGEEWVVLAPEEEVMHYLAPDGRILHADTTVHPRASFRLDLAEGREYDPKHLLYRDPEDPKKATLLIPHAPFDLASARFQRLHCLRYAGLTTLGERTVHRVDFVPTRDHPAPALAGTFYLDADSLWIPEWTFYYYRLPPLPKTRYSAITGTVRHTQVYPGVAVPSELHVVTRYWGTRLKGRPLAVRIQYTRHTNIRPVRKDSLDAALPPSPDSAAADSTSRGTAPP